MLTSIEKFGEQRGLLPSTQDVPDYPQLADEKLNLPFNVMILPGAFLDKTAYEPYAQVLDRQFGQHVEIHELDHKNPDKTLDDYAEDVIDSMGDRDNWVLNPHSRPYEVVVRAVSILEQRKELHRVRLVVPMNTSGSRLITPDDPQLEAAPRHSADFQAGITDNPDDNRFERIDRDTARRFFGRFIDDPVFMDSIIAGIHDQPKIDMSQEAFRGYSKRVRTAVIQGAQDPVVNLARANALLLSAHGQRPREIQGAGHMLQAEQPHQAASLLLKHAVVAQIR